MTREIKFRAWNTKSKEMFSAEIMADDQMTLLPTGKFINVSSESTTLSHIYSVDVMIPLQFTSLKDKNGVEIYEGDIVKSVTVPTTYEIIEWSEEWVGFIRKLNGFDMGLQACKERLEVIGNIYQNPELLK